MPRDTHVLPQQGVERLVLEALLAAGLRDDAAALLAHALSNGERVQKLLASWTDWATTNCLSCAHSPISCPYFGAASNLGEFHAVSASIETQVFRCPSYQPEDGTPPS